MAELGAHSRPRRLLPPGVTEWQLRSGEYRQLFKGVHVHRSTPLTTHLLARAALLLCSPDAAVSHHTAARIWGGTVPDDGLVHVIEPGTRRRVSGIRAHRVAPGGEPCHVVGGIRVVTPAQTFIDLRRELGLLDLVVLGDSLVRKGVLTPNRLITAAAECSGAHNRVIRQAAGLVREAVDSPMESRLRLLLVLAGLPEPVINHAIRWPEGEVRYRFDLAYPEYRLIIEYDGRQHAEDDRQWSHDLNRREWIDSNGWRILVMRGVDLYNTPGRTLDRVVKAMHDVGMPVPRLSGAWRLHFPSRAGDQLPA